MENTSNVYQQACDKLQKELLAKSYSAQDLMSSLEKVASSALFDFSQEQEPNHFADRFFDMSRFAEQASVKASTNKDSETEAQFLTMAKGLRSSASLFRTTTTTKTVAAPAAPAKEHMVGAKG